MEISYASIVLLWSFGVASELNAQTVASGLSVELYADVTDPRGLSFDAGGNLFVGRDNSGSGGGFGDPVKIHRVSPGGLTVVEYGNSTIIDPDTVLVDTGGLFGPAGSVITGGQISNSAGGFLSLVEPSEVIVDLFPAPTSPFVSNPSDLAFDSTGRLLLTDSPNPGFGTNGVFETTGPTDPPSVLFTTSERPGGIAVDSADQIFVSTEDGRVEVHQSNGTLIDASFVTGLGYAASLAFGSLGNSNTYLFTTNSTGELLRVDGTGTVSVIGTGFASIAW